MAGLVMPAFTFAASCLAACTSSASQFVGIEAPVVALAGLHAQPHEALRLALVLGPQPQFAPAHLEDLLVRARMADRRWLHGQGGPTGADHGRCLCAQCDRPLRRVI